MFNRLFGGGAGAGAIERSARAASSTNLTAPRSGVPSYAVATPSRLTVEFHAHESMDDVKGNFLTAISNGLVAKRQRELVLTLRLGDSEDPIPTMQQIVLFFSTVHAWSRQGHRVDQGDFTQFGERGLFQRPNSGLLYADARPIAEVSLPTAALAAIVVDAKEVRTALDYGTYRVLTRIGLQLRLFPYPCWGALDRPNAMTDREGETGLSKYARLRVPSISFLVEKQCLRVTIPTTASGSFRGLSKLPEGAPFALLTRPALSANAIRVWSPGQEGTRGLSPDDSDRSRMSGSCLLVVPRASADRAVEFEDGFALNLTAVSWARLANALMARQPYSSNLSEGMRLVVEWIHAPHR